MINNIEAAYKSIIEWKKRFEKIFSPDVMNSRTFKLEELARYERLLSRGSRGLSTSDLMFRKMAGQERKKLLKSLYPNPLIRLIRNSVVGTISAVRKLADAFGGEDKRSGNTALLQQCRDAGFSGVEKAIESKLERGETNFRIDQYVSAGRNETLTYSLDFSSEDGEQTRLKGFDLVRQTQGGKVERFRFDLSDRISAQQALELSSGRAVFLGDSTWQVVDFNDRNSDGCFLPKQVSVPDFDVGQLLGRLALNLSDGERTELGEGLKQGRKMSFEGQVEGKTLQLQVEAMPLKGTLQFYHDGKRTSLGKQEPDRPKPIVEDGNLKVAHRQKGIHRTRSS